MNKYTRAYGENLDVTVLLQTRTVPPRSNSLRLTQTTMSTSSVPNFVPVCLELDKGCRKHCDIGAVVFRAPGGDLLLRVAKCVSRLEHNDRKEDGLD
jgi:hypothetical protein